MSFSAIQQRAEDKKGGAKALAELMPADVSREALLALGDDRWLSMMTRCVFRAGFVWRIIDHKWAGFETAFSGFNPYGMAHLSDDRLEELARDTRIVRNHQKIKSVRDNAIFVTDMVEAHGSFSQFVADWPSDDIVGLWAVMKKQGSRLGGNTGPMVLRSLGKDTFILTNDVITALVSNGILDDNKVTSQRAQRAIQAAFSAWQAETGLPLAHLSRIAAISIGTE